jgi:S-adenosylmethionine-diacylglycerol 3-amino-3-carboxypropyl transferase
MRHIPAQLDIVRCIRERFDRAASSFLFRDSAWAWLVFRGYLSATGPLPPHLQRDCFTALAAAAHAVTPVTASLLSYLTGAGVAPFTAFSVSDFGSYADDATYAATYAALRAAAAQGARLCERQFLVPRDPIRLPGLALQRDTALEQALAHSDNSVVYDFVSGVFI